MNDEAMRAAPENDPTCREGACPDAHIAMERFHGKRHGIAVVVIGRNEGARLVACLSSLSGQDAEVVYVDSGSTDNSVAEAQNASAKVVALNTSVPFTAARARNAGVEALSDDVEFVQFVDGDCWVEPGWLELARQELSEKPDLGIITGWRREIHPDASVYNAMCDFEWHRPPGEIDVCGGDMMVRRSVFDRVGGFTSSLIAGEDEEFCLRIRQQGAKIIRLPRPMTHHDAAMTRFSQWWKRTERAGHAFAQIGAMHPPHFRREQKRVMVFGLLLPVLLLIGLALACWLVLLVVLAYGLSYHRTVKGLRSEGVPAGQALHHGLFLSLSKFPNLIGMTRYFWRRLRGRTMYLIEYK